MPKKRRASRKYKRLTRRGNVYRSLAPYYLSKSKKFYRPQAGLRFKSPAGSAITQSPFPPVLWTTMTFAETFNLTQTVGGAPDFRTYRANSPYDPRLAVGGTSTRYFDSLLGAEGGTAPYRKYRCFASKIKLSIFPTQSTLGGNALVSIIPMRATSTAPSTTDEMRIRPYGSNRDITMVASTKPYVLKNFCKVKHMLGMKDIEDDDGTSAEYNANPIHEIYWNIGVASIDSAYTAVITCQVQIVYYVQLFQLADVADS